MSHELELLVVSAALLATGYRLWADALAARAAANRIAREICSRAVVQFLDDTVAFAGFRLGRDLSGRRRLLRTYTFDYTHDGFERSQGLIVLAGGRLETVKLAGDPA